MFEEEEKSYLQPLPQTRYKLTEWKNAKVQQNYHIHVERMYYSVPYEYVREYVDIRLTTDIVEFYFKDVRIASHKRLSGEIGQYSTNNEHMPDHHRLYLDHNPENNRQWADTIGPYMHQFVSYILKTNPEKKSLKYPHDIRNLATKHSNKDLESAVQTLLEISNHPTISVLKGILDRHKKRMQKHPLNQLNSSDKADDHGFVRGAQYFGRDK